MVFTLLAWMVALVLIAGLAVGGYFAYRAWSKKSAQALYNQAIDIYQSGDYAAALSLLLRSQKMNPQFENVYYNLGLVYQHLDQPEEAKQAFQTSLAYLPDDLETLYNLGMLYYTQENYGEAEALLRHASAVHPNDGDSHYGLGMILEAQNKPDQAILAYSRCLEQDPGNLNACLYWGKLLDMRGKSADAIEVYERGLGQDAENPDLNYEISISLAKSGNWDATITHCQQSIAADPAVAKAYNQLGLAFYCKEMPQEAIEQYEQAIVLDPDYTTAYNNLGYAYEKLERYQDAVQSFELYLQKSDDPTECQEIQKHVQQLQKKLLEA